MKAPVGLVHTQALCEIDDPFRLDDDLFVAAMREGAAWHIAHSDFYRKLCEAEGFDPAALRTVADCARLPMVPAEFFKAHAVRSVPEAGISQTLTSSGTTGLKSQMPFDEWSLGSAQRMVRFVFERLGWHTPGAPVNYLLYTYEAADPRLGTAFTDYFLCQFAPAREVFCALRSDGRGGHEFDPFGCMAKLEAYAAAGSPVRIFGFPSFLNFTLERMKALGRPPLRLHPDSLVFLGGGWKGHADQQIPKRALYAEITRQLGVVDERIRDGFGSVEHCVPYVECGRHEFHVPTWSRVFVRDLKTLAPLPYGQAGFLHFVSPYITSVPAQSVMMGDLATLHPGAECGCGIAAPFFRVLGRAGTSRNKSCAVAASELLRGRSS